MGESIRARQIRDRSRKDDIEAAASLRHGSLSHMRPPNKPGTVRNGHEAEKPHRALRQRNILAELSPAAREALLSHCERQRFAGGEGLYTQGGRHKTTYLLTSGLVRSYHTSFRGKELTIGYWSAGDLIGGPHFFDDVGLHLWSARAVEDTEAYAISGRDLRKLALDVREIGDIMLDVICFKLLWDSLLMQVLGTRSVSARLADLLVKLVALHGEATADGIAICRRFSQDDLACMIGATRQWINAKIVNLERRGLLLVRDNRLVVRDLARLKELVN